MSLELWRYFPPTDFRMYKPSHYVRMCMPGGVDHDKQYILYFVSQMSPGGNESLAATKCTTYISPDIWQYILVIH